MTQSSPTDLVYALVSDISRLAALRHAEFFPSLFSILEQYGVSTTLHALSARWDINTSQPTLIWRYSSDPDTWALARDNISGVPAINVPNTTKLELRFDPTGYLSHFQPYCVLLCDPIPDAFPLSASQISETIRRAYVGCLKTERAEIRKQVVVDSVSSRDLNSFLFRTISNLGTIHPGFGGLSIFRLEPHTRLIRLGASTGLSNKGPKKDIFYTMEDRSWVVRSFKTNTPIVEYSRTSSLHKGRFSEEAPKGIWSRVYYPLGPQYDSVSNAWPWPSFGVLRAINRSLECHGLAIPSGLTWEDHYLLDFTTEVLAVISNSYLRIDVVALEMESLIHGIDHDLKGTRDKIFFFKNLVYGSEIIGLRPKLQIRPGEGISLGQLNTIIDTAVAFVDDLAFQVEKVKAGESTSRNTDVRRVERLFSDAIQKATNLKDAIAQRYGRHAPHINNLKAAGAVDLPPVMGNEAGLISVFRNLLENSIKYCPRDRVPEIEFAFHSSADSVAIRIQDNGIGIQPDEERFLFTRSFRGQEARALSQMGTGIGLHYSQQVVKSFGGSIALLRNGRPGACFQITLRRAV